MYISIKNSKNFETSHFDQAASYITSQKFIDHIGRAINATDEDTRYLHQISDSMFSVAHTEIIKSEPLTEMFLNSYDSYGLLDLIKVGGNSNQTNLFWIIKSNAKVNFMTGFGLIARNSNNAALPKPLARLDHLWIAGNSSSTVLAIDKGPSHMKS